MKIDFEKVSLQHIDIIFDWLNQDFIKEFWDNTQDHKNDIINFVQGRKISSTYCDGKYYYWIATVDNKPFAMLMTIQETHEENIGPEKQALLSKTGNTYGIDYMIGNIDFFGKGYGVRTLIEFLDYFRTKFDTAADTFLIDPAHSNPRAKYVYLKAGFEFITDFIMTGTVSGAGQLHHLLVKKFFDNLNV